MTLYETGRICVKVVGREAGSHCVVVEQKEANYVVVTGPKHISGVRRRLCNIRHLEPLDNIPKWLAPRDDAGALRWFFEGLPEGEAIPWGEWAIPLFWWLIFIGAVVFLSVCIAVILRKQWAVNERLAYPLTSVTEEIVSRSDEPGLLPAFMRGRLFW